MNMEWKVVYYSEQNGSMPVNRILYFFCYQNFIILTNAFDKHSNKVPKEQIKIAKENRDDYLNRFSEKDIEEKNYVL